MSHDSINEWSKEIKTLCEKLLSERTFHKPEKKVRISLETAHENLFLSITQITDKEEYKIKELKVIWQG